MKVLLYVVFLWCLLSAPGLTGAQNCTKDDQVQAEEAVRLSDFVALLTVKIPRSCGNFSALMLIPCRDELNVVSGCCVEECQAVFAQYTASCLQDLAAVLCRTPITAAAVPLMDGVSSRCDDDYKMVTCGEAEEIERGNKTRRARATTEEMTESGNTTTTAATEEEEDEHSVAEAPGPGGEEDLDEAEMDKDVDTDFDRSDRDN